MKAEHILLCCTMPLQNTAFFFFFLPPHLRNTTRGKRIHQPPKEAPSHMHIYEAGEGKDNPKYQNSLKNVCGFMWDTRPRLTTLLEVSEIVAVSGTQTIFIERMSVFPVTPSQTT